jgi:hypothetical protein
MSSGHYPQVSGLPSDLQEAKDAAMYLGRPKARQ